MSPYSYQYFADFCWYQQTFDQVYKASFSKWKKRSKVKPLRIWNAWAILQPDPLTALCALPFSALIQPEGCESFPSHSHNWESDPECAKMFDLKEQFK